MYYAQNFCYILSMENSKPRPGLPPNAHLVFKGVIFETWQWEQEMFDGSKATFERIWRCPTVEVIATVGDKILLEEQGQPDKKDNLNFPSGRADQSEDLLLEAKRELLEETGYQSGDWSVFLKHIKDGKLLQEVRYFIARNCTKVQEPNLDAGEKIRTKLITFDELIALAQEPRFWVGPEFVIELLNMQLNPQKKDEFKKLLFP